MNDHMHRVVHYGEEVTCPKCGNRRRVLLRCDDGETRCGPCFSGMEDERGKFVADEAKKYVITWFVISGCILMALVIGKIIYVLVKR